MKNLFKSFSQIGAAYSNRTSPEGLQLLARIYWRFVLVFCLVVMIAAAALGGLKMHKVLGTFGDKLPVEEESPITLSAEKLEDVFSVFESRKARFTTIQVGTSSVQESLR